MEKSNNERIMRFLDYARNDMLEGKKKTCYYIKPQRHFDYGEPKRCAQTTHNFISNFSISQRTTKSDHNVISTEAKRNGEI